jgi:hypothetical protein
VHVSPYLQAFWESQELARTLKDMYPTLRPGGTALANLAADADLDDGDSPIDVWLRACLLLHDD